MSPPNTSASCSVTASGNPAASAAAKSDERISPAAMLQRTSTGAGADVADERVAVARDRQEIAARR